MSKGIVFEVKAHISWESLKLLNINGDMESVFWSALFISSGQWSEQLLVKCSRLGWIGIWATWSSGRWLCRWRGGWN